MSVVDAGLVCLLVSDAALATLVFTLFWRPERAMGVVARLAGQESDWFAGTLSEEEELRLLRMAGMLRLPGLLALFAWSGFVGAWMAGAGRIAVVIPGG